MGIPVEALVKMNTGVHQCDICDEDYEVKDRHYCVTSRPSDPTELVAVMWTGPCCAQLVGAMSREQVEKYFEDNQYPKGKLMFNSVY